MARIHSFGNLLSEKFVDFVFLTASTNLKGAIYAFCRSAVAVGFLFGFCYGALEETMVCTSHKSTLLSHY